MLINQPILSDIVLSDKVPKWWWVELGSLYQLYCATIPMSLDITLVLSLTWTWYWCFVRY